MLTLRSASMASLHAKRSPDRCDISGAGLSDVYLGAPCAVPWDPISCAFTPAMCTCEQCPSPCFAMLVILATEEPACYAEAPCTHSGASIEIEVHECQYHFGSFAVENETRERA